jgi:hypothetical protein
MGAREEVHSLKHKQGDRRQRQSTIQVKCKYCGRKHEKSRDKCTAFGKKCKKKCGNHFAAICKQKSGEFARRKSEDIKYVKETKDPQKAMGAREEVHSLKHKQGDRRQRQSTIQVKCKYCGRKHEKSRDKCTAFGKKCKKKCGNHFAAICKQKSGEFARRKSEDIKYVKETKDPQNSSDDEYCFMVSTENSNESVKQTAKQPFRKKIFATMKLAGQSIRFQVDSGATCNVICRRDLPKNCRVEQSKKVLHMFNGTQMVSHGKCLVNMVNPKNGTVYETEFVVVEEECNPLLGSKTVQQMDLVEVKYENIAMVRENADREQMGLTMHQISQEYEDIFTGEGEFRN